MHVSNVFVCMLNSFFFLRQNKTQLLQTAVVKDNSKKISMLQAFLGDGIYTDIDNRGRHWEAQEAGQPMEYFLLGHQEQKFGGEAGQLVECAVFEPILCCCDHCSKGQVAALMAATEKGQGRKALGRWQTGSLVECVEKGKEGGMYWKDRGWRINYVEWMVHNRLGFSTS